MFVHPDYNPGYFWENDIALFKLSVNTYYLILQISAIFIFSFYFRLQSNIAITYFLYAFPMSQLALRGKQRNVFYFIFFLILRLLLYTLKLNILMERVP